MNTSSLKLSLNGGNRRSTSFRFFQTAKYTRFATVSSRRALSFHLSTFVQFLCLVVLSTAVSDDVSSTRRRLLSQKSTAAKLNRQSSRARDVVLFSRPPRPLPPPAGRRCFERNVGERRESSKFETKRRKFEGTGSGRALKLFLDGRKLLMRIKGTFFFFPSQSEEDKCNGEMGQVENEVKRLRGKRIAW